MKNMEETLRKLNKINNKGTAQGGVGLEHSPLPYPLLELKTKTMLRKN
jgi:hypothetical protein